MLLITDFCYYWAHRLGHEYNWMWAGHSIHHSSENFNLSTALRQSSFQQVLFWYITQLPKCLLRIPYKFAEFHMNLNTVSQFWIHTQYIKNLGWIEYIINTPYQ